MRSMRWLLRSAGPGAALAVAAALANHVPLFLDEVGLARADRSGWSQAAEFASLILDSGWAWAALAGMSAVAPSAATAIVSAPALDLLDLRLPFTSEVPLPCGVCGQRYLTAAK